MIGSPWTEPGVHGPYAHDSTYFAIHIESDPDEYGRQLYRLVWWDDVRGQRWSYRLRANVAEHIAGLERACDVVRWPGRRVVVIENVFEPVPNPS